MSATRRPSANDGLRAKVPTLPVGGSGVALWQLLQLTAQCLLALRSGRSGTAALDQVDPAWRPAVQALSFQVWRSLARAEHLRSQLARRAPPPHADALLCVVLALAWDPLQAPYTPFTLVDQAVEAAKRMDPTRGQAGFINACLRRFLRERDALVAASEHDAVAVWNHPAWWIERLRHDHPDRWRQVLAADRVHAPMTLRVNCRRSSVHDFIALLARQGIDATAVGPTAVQLARPMPVHRIAGFDAGLVSVQDAAAQRAAPLLLDGLSGGKPLRVLDACAAPGGKTAHLLEMAECHVTALDIDPVRCARIGQTLDRLGLRADIRAADAAQSAQWWDGVPFDAILLDAPCTGSGIVRRHPDVPWLRRASDVDQLARQQARLLASLWPLLRTGGRLLYCTCSVFRGEGDNQIQTFVEHNTDAALLPSPGHLLPCLTANDNTVPDNRDGDHDGFFYALLEKRAR